MKNIKREEQVIEYFLCHHRESISLQKLSDTVGKSKYELCRKFTKVYGESPIKVLWIFRTELAAQVIALRPEWELSVVAKYCGFIHCSHFSKLFRHHFQVSPSQFRQKFIKGPVRTCFVALINNSELKVRAMSNTLARFRPSLQSHQVETLVQ